MSDDVTYSINITRHANGGRATIEWKGNDLHELLAKVVTQTTAYGWLNETPDLPTMAALGDPEKITIDDLGPWSVRTRACLRIDNIVTLADLLRRSRVELLRTPNFGRKSLREIEEALTERGLRLRDHER